MATLEQTSPKAALNYVLLVAILAFLPLTSSSSSNDTGLIARLIPPLSRESPFFQQILNANNFSLSMSDQVVLNRTHYLEWLTQELSKINVGDDKHSMMFYSKLSGYCANMFIGSPLQSVYGVFDTGSELVWLQCEGNPTGRAFPNFNESKSFTYKTIPCTDKDMCDLSTSVNLRCGIGGSCEFEADYVDNTHAEGVMGTDVVVTSLHNDPVGVPDLMFGCTSKNAKKNIMGIIGAGNGKYSFPMQVRQYDPKFSYCISDDMTRSYEIKFGQEAALIGRSTKVLKHKFMPFYYLDVLGIQVNGKSLNVPPYVFEMSPDGIRGFIIDSGSTLSYLTAKVFDALKYEIEQILGISKKYQIYDICYPPSRFPKMRVKYEPTITIQFPEFDLTLPSVNTWEMIGKKSKYLCLLIRRTEYEISTLGLEQLWDINVGHDPKNGLLYLSHTQCPFSQ